GKHHGVHLGRQNAAHHPLQNLRVRHALGAIAGNAWREARCEPWELRSRTHCVSASSAVRRSEYVEIHRRVVQSPQLVVSEAPNPSIEGTSTSKLRLLTAAPHVKR